MYKRQVRRVVGGLIALAVGTAGAASSATAGDDEANRRELEKAIIVFFGDEEDLLWLEFADAMERPLEGGIFATYSDAPFLPVGDAPVEGDPNPSCGAVAQPFRFDGAAATAETFSLAAFGEAVNSISPGDPSFFRFQQAFTFVVACFRTSPLRALAAISEISMSYRLFGQAMLEQSPFPGEPHLGMNSVVSSSAIKGIPEVPEDELLSGLSFVVDGAFSPAPTNPIPTFEFWAPQGYFQAWAVPGIPEEVRVNTADSGVAEVNAVSNQQIVLTPNQSIIELNDPNANAAVALALPGVAQMFLDAQPTTPLTGAEPEPDATGTDESAPEVTTSNQPDTAAAESTPTTLAAPTEGGEATAPTSTTVSTTTTLAATGESSGGIPGWLLVLLPVALVAAIVAFVLWWRKKWEREAAAGGDDPPGDADTGPVTGRAGAKNTPTPPAEPTPEHQGGATTAPPVVPGAPPPLVQCDWELFLGDRRLKQAAPGHLACCIYRLEIETLEMIPDRQASFAGDESERVRVPGFRSAAVGLGYEAQVMAHSQPGDAPFEATDPEWSSMATSRSFVPSGVLPDVAAYLRSGATTTVVVTLESQCRDHRHQYSGSAEPEVEVGAGGRCTNRAHGDRCEVWLGAVATGDVLVAGDLDADASAEVDLGGPDQRGDRPPHDHEGHDGAGEPVVNESVSGAGGPTSKQGFDWSATFSSVFTLDAAQIVPAVVRSDTDDVEARAVGSASHSLSLVASTLDRACAGAACGCGATECTCVPSFELTLNAETQLLVVDNRPWTLAPDPDSDAWKAH